MKSKRIARQEVTEWLGADGWRIEGVLTYPLYYKAGQKYPLVLQIHGGPEGVSLNGWTTIAGYPVQVLAGEGYFVLQPNYRGSGGRGVDFSKADHDDLGGKEFEDVLAGVDTLIERGIECHRMRGWEADDIMATICRDNSRVGCDVVMVTRDKDMWQLIKAGVWCYDPMKQALVGADEVVKKFGVRPPQMLDFLSLMGDSADNIPGVKGIGQKGAAALLQEHLTLDAVYDHLDDLHTKVAEKLRAGRRSAFASRDLVRLRCDVPLKGEKS